jgi:cyclohexanecarboxylate-CoA ligase
MSPTGATSVAPTASQPRRGSAAERIRDGYRLVGILEERLLDADLSRRAGARPSDPYIRDGRGDHTYGQVWSAVLGFAGTLLDLGVGPGDVVSFQLPNRVEAAVTYFAALAVGAICNPIVPIYREREIGFVLRQARPSVVVVPATYRGVDYPELHRRAADHAGHHPVQIVVDGAGTGLDYTDAVAHRPAEPLPGRRAADRAVLLYTSGTTADPKGVLHSHQSLRSECASIVQLTGLVGSDVVFMASPVTHVTGLLYGVQMPAMLGGSSVLQETWDPSAATSLIRAAGCTFTVGATPFLHGLVEAANGEDGPIPLRTFVCGGADVPPDLVLRARARLHVEVVRAYGLSELPTVTCGALHDRPEKRASTDGRPPTATRVRVRDGDGRMRPVGSGELEASAPELFLGYLDRQLDEAAFTDDGWFRTGDLATIDADGYVTILGRIKDVIVRGGENISAKEVEDVLFQHPAVSEIAVVGYPDPVMGQRMCAFVVTADGLGPSPADLAAFLDGHGVARQKSPERVVMVASLPKTPSGKVQKHRLRELAAASGEDRP